MSNKKYHEIETSVRCRAFSGEGVRENRVTVDESGVVRVYDSVAGHFTVLHSLSESAQRRVRKMAEVSS